MSGRTYSQPAPGPPHSHFTEPPTQNSTPSAVTSSGTVPADWYASRQTYAPIACARSTMRSTGWISARLVEHVRDRHEERALVDRVDHRLGVGAHDDLGAEARPRLLHVAHRREQALLEHDPVARRLQVEAREHDRLCDRHVLVHHRRAGRRADDLADDVAGREDGVPPALAPRARAARPPLGRELLQPPLRLRGHRAERVVDQVRRRLEDREAVAVALSAPCRRSSHRLHHRCRRRPRRRLRVDEHRRDEQHRDADDALADERPPDARQEAGIRALQRRARSRSGGTRPRRARGRRARSSRAAPARSAASRGRGDAAAARSRGRSPPRARARSAPSPCARS